MSVEYIMRRVGMKTGLVPSRTEDRLILADYINEAALELYEELLDIPEFLKEVTVEVQEDSTIALPNDVAYIRAIRESSNLTRQFSWNLLETYQKYQDGVVDNSLWTSWVIKGHKATNDDITAGVITLTIPVLDNTIVTLVGPTANASRHIEQITMDGVTKVSTASFTRLDEIYKSGINNYDITVKDSTNTTVAVIPNNQVESKYLIVDVSDYPEHNEDLSMDVLYKVKLPYLYNDTDTFPAWGYDDTLANKAVQLWAEDNNELEKGIIADRRITRTLKRKEANQHKGQTNTAQFYFNTPDITTRYRNPVPWRRIRRG